MQHTHADVNDSTGAAEMGREIPVVCFVFERVFKVEKYLHLPG